MVELLLKMDEAEKVREVTRCGELLAVIEDGALTVVDLNCHEWAIVGYWLAKAA
jgi:hypothetical protein